MLYGNFAVFAFVLRIFALRFCSALIFVLIVLIVTLNDFISR